MGDQADRERRKLRGANTLGWLVGPAIVVAIVIVGSGCDGQRGPASPTSATEQVLPDPAATEPDAST